MAKAYFPIKNFIDLSQIPSSIKFELEPLIDKIGINDIILEQIPRTIDLPNQEIDLEIETLVSEEEALELIGWFENQLEELAPEVNIPQPQIEVEELAPNKSKYTYELAFLSEVVLDLEDFAGIQLVFNPEGFQAVMIVEGKNWELTAEVSVRLKLSKQLFKPMIKKEKNGQILFEVDTDRDAIDVDLAKVRISVNQAGKIQVAQGLAFDIGQAIQLGDSGIILEASGASLNLSGEGKQPTTANDNWKGLYLETANIYFTKFLQKPINAKDLGIGKGGFTGDLSGDFDLDFSDNRTPKFKGTFTTQLFGLAGGISSIDLKFVNNLPKEGGLEGKLLLPFFKKPVGLLLTFEENGEFKAKLTDVNQFDNIFISEECIIVQRKSDIKEVTQELASGILDNLEGKEVDTTFRIIRGDGVRIDEIRVDWAINEAKTIKIPGLAFTTPPELLLSLVLQNESNNGQLPHKAKLIATLKAGTVMSAQTNFAWTRAEERELHNDENFVSKPGETAKKPLISLDLTAKKDVSLALLSFDTKEKKLPTFFKQYTTPIEKLVLEADPVDNDAEKLCVLIPTKVGQLKKSAWGVNFNFNLDNDQFKLPFLRNNDQADTSPSGISQYLNIKKPTGKPAVDFEKTLITCPLQIGLNLNKFKIGTEIDLAFDWEKFAFKVDHGAGIEMVSENEVETFSDFLGMDWRFKGKKLKVTGQEKPKYHHFTLLTDKYNYQIKQAAGAILEIDFTKASETPITFKVSEFAISPKGVSLTAEVTDRPAKLNGINTKFRFEGSKLQIVENKIQAFTLSGSGPLPPDLVGDAVADIALQFEQRGGKLTLASGAAQLRGEKLLDAKSTRFQFQIDAIGLKFVNDGGYHLYFTLTGSAAFVLAKGDDVDGPLGLLPQIKIDFIECPLTGDMSVLAKHIQFNIELPRPISFSFLGAFQMEIRGFGFIPQALQFAGDAAMLLSGQVRFAIGGKDTQSAKFDFHGLYIGIPEKGKFIPRINLEKLGLEIKVGSAFELSGVVSFVDGAQQKGFLGEGKITIKGLPTMAASFAFLRARKDAKSAWLRAWFVYLEVGKISLEIPVIKLYLREVGLGFGYRYTLSSIKAADSTNDTGLLIQKLDELSRTQGNLSKIEAWALDLEDNREDPRWTIVFRAMISQTSASSPLKYNEDKEKDLPSVFLFDAVVAFRSDLTFLMAVRTWLNTNYNDYISSEEVRNRPLLSGYVLLSPRRKRFLARVASNPQGLIGNHPPFPDFIKRAIQNSRFSITLLIEPGLFHYEMGWPNQLGWKDKFGPLEVDINGGFIFRISKSEMVIGQSIMARGQLKIDGGVSLGVVGARVSATAKVAYGARYIGVIFLRGNSSFAFYGAIGLEINVKFSVRFWVKIKLGFVKVRISIGFSLQIGFTAGLEVGLDGLKSPGLRGRATISISALGKSIRLKLNISANESAVVAAKSKTAKFLKIGLVASDTPIEPVPGFGTKNLILPKRRALSSRRSNLTPPVAIKAPGYLIFVLREKAVDGHCYFVLLPQGETLDGKEESGFLPVPPAINEAGEMIAPPSADFTLALPKGDGSYVLEQYDPFKGTFTTHKKEKNKAKTISWRTNWQAALADKTDLANNIELVEESADTAIDDAALLQEFKLYKYLRNAFLQEGEALADPVVFPIIEKIKDIRVQNPTDNAYEEAVRGAFEQFRGSPFFKNDLTNEYEQLLQQAFDEEQSIYAVEADQLSSNNNATERELREQADQLRGIIFQNMMTDLENYIKVLNAESNQAPILEKSFAFQMGLVFRVAETEAPLWLKENVAPTQAPKIKQRVSQAATTPDSAFQPVRTFNIQQTDFAVNTPQFERIQHYTDSGTVAITWDLVWNDQPADNCTNCQADPEHHLKHYLVKRTALDNSEPVFQFTLKNAAALCLQKDPADNLVLKALQARFKLVDHFEGETATDLANLPESGKSYLYTITPVDFAENRGRPISLVATRYPSLPPQVPADGELVVTYKLPEAVLNDTLDQSEPFRIIRPTKLTISWQEPTPPRDTPYIPIKTYRLIFRREELLPLGSYGLDGDAMGPVKKKLPTSNARPLPSDKKIEIYPKTVDQQRVATIFLEDSVDLQGEARANNATIVAAMEAAGILPKATNKDWQPEAWNVYFQTVSINGVPSGLAPVQLILKVTPNEESLGAEERRPVNLEWLPFPVKLDLLPPEDKLAETGTAHFPMPSLGNFNFTGDLIATQYTQHPLGIRAIRFLWNQSSATQANYQSRINAGYELLKLDADAFPTTVFEQKEKLGAALESIQEVQIVPAEDLLFIPGDTLNTSQWEAWYPSSILRLENELKRPEGAETPYGAWYSWRDSILLWPERADYSRNSPDTFLHPFLQQIIRFIDSKDQDIGLGLVADVQIPPPMQPTNLENFLKSTAPEADTYGWGVLQRFGLSTTISVRDANDGRIIHGAALLNLIKTAIDSIKDLGKGETSVETLKKHLFVELLYQQGKSVAFEKSSTATDSLLAIIQLSLRPIFNQVQEYHQISIEGPPNTKIGLQISLDTNDTCTFLNQSATERAEIQLINEEKTSVNLTTDSVVPLNGALNLLLRCKGQAPDFVFVFYLAQKIVKAIPKQSPLATFVKYDAGKKRLLIQPNFFASTPFQNLSAELAKILAPADQYVLNYRVQVNELFAPTNDRSIYFTTPPAIIQQFSDGAEERKQWHIFKAYAESLNSNNPNDPKISIPTAGVALEKVVPEYLIWSQRFFDHATPPIKTEDGETEGNTQKIWLATAYPRVGSPAFVTPDLNYRLKHDHLIEDQYAHNYRFYIRPYGRYDLLWQSFRQSPILFPNLSESAIANKALPNPMSPALDVVLDRIKAVTKPVILSSTRLDQPVPINQPAIPGHTWEVIIAQHPEQALMERNQTLYRLLSFRNIAYSLLRRFALPNLPKDLVDAINTHDTTIAYAPIPIDLVQDSYPDIPNSLPKKLPHLDTAKLSKKELLSLNIPSRLGKFNQNALVLQWEGLPFFYEQQLLLIAQTATTVSKVNAIVQQDFHYQTPIPTAYLKTILAHKKRQAILLIPLKRLWDALGKTAQQHWIAERPLDKGSKVPQRKYASLPDLEVVYQIVELFSGNIEVQSEYFFNKTFNPNGTVLQTSYENRQLAERFTTELEKIIPPSEAAPQADFYLRLTFDTSSPKLPMLGRYRLSKVLAPTKDKISIIDQNIIFQETITRFDIDNILWNANEVLVNNRAVLEPDLAEDNPTARASFLTKWFNIVEIRRKRNWDNLPNTLLDKLDFPFIPKSTSLPLLLQAKLRLDAFQLSWQGFISSAQFNLLERYPQTLEAEFYDSTKQSFNQFNKLFSVNLILTETYEELPPTFSNKPTQLKILINRQIQEDAPKPLSVSWKLEWTGALDEAKQQQLLGLSTEKSFQTAIQQLIEKLTTSNHQVFIIKSNFSMPDMDQLQITPQNQGDSDIKWRLNWTGLMSKEQEETLLSLEGDTVFSKGIKALIATVANFKAVENLEMPYPIFDLDRLAQETGLDLTGLQFNPNLNGLIWRRSLINDLSTDEFLNRIDSCLHAEDPLRAAILKLWQQFEKTTTTQSILFPQLVRATQVLSAEENNLLQEAATNEKDRTALKLLYQLLVDRATLLDAQKSMLTTVPVSQKLTTTVIAEDFLNFDQPIDNTLVLIDHQNVDFTALEKLAGDTAFKEAITQLIALAKNSEKSIPQITLAPDPRHILEAFSDKGAFELNVTATHYAAIRWKGWMSEATRKSIDDRANFEAIDLAVNQLFEQLTRTQIKVTLPSFLPKNLAKKLQLNATQLAWLGKKPTKTETTALKKLIAKHQQFPVFATAMEALLTKLNGTEGLTAVTTIRLQDSDFPFRPLLAELPPILQKHLQLIDNALIWTSLLLTESTHEALQALQKLGDEAFQKAIQSLLKKMGNHAIRIPFEAAIRPHQADLPETLQKHLLIGKYSMHFLGGMLTTEGNALIEAMENSVDKVAAAQLYEWSQQRWINDRDLRIRARRGAAEPSEMIPFSAKLTTLF